MHSELDNIEEYDNDGYFDQMAELIHPFLDDLVAQGLINIQEEHKLSDSMVHKLIDSWLMKLNYYKLQEAINEWTQHQH